MDSFKLVRRRTADLVENAQKKLPSMPQLPQMQLPQMPQVQMPQMQMPQMPSVKGNGKDSMKGTWERVDIPALPRSSHSLNIVSGSAYLFGGEISPRRPVDNDMHVITLPFSSAGADYYRIKSVAAVREPEAQPASESQPEEQKVQEERKDLDDVPLASPQLPKEPDASIDEATTTTTEADVEASQEIKKEDKGKGKEVASDEKAVLGDVPKPRVGHATAVIGSRIFLFGGRGGPDMKPLEEAGRVWTFDTRSRVWTYLDPVPAVKGGAIIPHPAPRSYHCATAIDRPQDFPAPAKPKKSRTWQQWAIGDISKTGIPQDPVVGHVAEEAIDQEDLGYGTFFVHAGCLSTGDRTNDIWAFDVRSRTWTELPAAPGPARGGTAICTSKSRLYRFGGFDGSQELGGQLDFLHLEVEMFDDQVTKGEVSLRARGGWQSILQDNIDASSDEIPSEAHQPWPAARSVAALQALTIGSGREYLVLAMGERDPSPDGHAGAGKFYGDVWTFQVPPLGMTAASLTAAMMQAVGRKTGEGKWIKVTTSPYDDESLNGEPAQRGWLASAPMLDLEESGVLIWGGLGGDNKRLGDGWILRLG